MKLKSFFACFFLASLSAFLCGCDYNIQEALFRDNSVENRVTALSDNIIPSDKLPSTFKTTDKIKVAIITDVHFGVQGKDSVNQKFLDWIADSSNNIDFCICLGDVAEHGAEDEYKTYASYVDQIKTALGGSPVFSVVGNHDLFSSGWSYWKQYVNKDLGLKTSFYKFSLGGYEWYFLDTASGTMGRSQFKAFKEDIESELKPKLVFSHYPIYSDGANLANYFTLQNSMETSRIIDACARNGVQLFASGHTHRWASKNFGRFWEVNFTGFRSRQDWGYIEIDTVNKTVSAYKSDGTKLN